MSKKKEKLWRPVVLEETHNGELGEAKKVFKKLAKRAKVLMEETYERVYGEDFDITQLMLSQAADCHVYSRIPEGEKGVNEEFFFMSASTASVKPNLLTGKEEGHVSIECRVPA